MDAEHPVLSFSRALQSVSPGGTIYQLNTYSLPETAGGTATPVFTAPGGETVDIECRLATEAFMQLNNGAAVTLNGIGVDLTDDANGDRLKVYRGHGHRGVGAARRHAADRLSARRS